MVLMQQIWQSMQLRSSFSIGTSFNDRITGKLHEFAPHAQIIHIDIDTASISRNIQVDIPIVADAKEAITKMNEYVQECSTDKWLNQIKMERRTSA